MRRYTVKMTWISICFILAISLTYAFSKPFNPDDIFDFDETVGKAHHNSPLSEESKRVTSGSRRLIKDNEDDDDDDDIEDDSHDGNGSKHKQHHHDMAGDPYEPEIVPRTQGVSLTDRIERANEGSRIRLEEGDIAPSKSNNKRVVTNVNSEKWPSGVIPYTFEASYPYKSAVLKGMRTLEGATCLTFREKTSSDANSIKIIIGGGCWSYVGLQGGQQEVSIDNGCQWESTVIHELMHAIGFSHEQNRLDRDSYLTVNFGNVKDGKSHNFDKKSAATTATYAGYDYKSIMHYGAYDFSKNGQRTMEAKSDPSMVLGGDYMTAEDVLEINKAYTCSISLVNGKWTEWSSPGRCSASCGPGNAVRTRSCSLPAPSGGGADCIGESTKTEACSDGTCPVPVVVVPGGDLACSFEDDMCGWQSNIGSSPYIMEFIRNRGRTPSGKTGPREDANGNKNGYYVYMEASVKPKNVYGQLISPKLAASSSGKRCVSYKVHMFGRGMGELRVIALNLDNNAKTVLREHNGNQHKIFWFANEVTFDASTPTKIIFEGKKKHSWRSDMALDDIVITQAACSSSHLDCDFETSTCEWRMVNSDYYPWELRNRRTPSHRVTGPLSAANGKGYIFVDGWSYDSMAGDESSLMSPTIETSSLGKICLTFSYHMDNEIDEYDDTSRDIGTLSVRTKGATGMNTVWSNSDLKGLDWVSNQVTIPSTEAMELEFHVLRGESYKGDVAVDNVKVIDGECFSVSQ